MKKIFFILPFIFFTVAKSQTPIPKDSLQTLSEIIVKAYENNRRLIDVAAPVSFAGKTELNRFSNTSIVSVINSLPGTKMEERSPGSYRLNIRGSSLRSPFGVRNVKVYYNEIPYTDPGGNTYLNQLGFYNIQSLEILKGPGSSLYGAGTGGVVLIRSDVSEFQQGATVHVTASSFNTQNFNANVRFGKTAFQNTINYQHLKSDGYRDHTKMQRDVFTWDATLKSSEKHSLKTHFLYSDLFYQTPGALTKGEYDVNPKASRPAAGANPSAVIAKATIYQKTFLAGITYAQLITSNFKNTTSLYGAFSKIKNPTFRNYEIRSEPHFGGRTLFNYSIQLPLAKFNYHVGAEFQKGFSSIKVYKNNAGSPDSLQTDDEVNNILLSIFTQASLELRKGWIFTAGASLNKNNLEFTRLSKVPSVVQNRKYKNEIAPRIAVLKKLTYDISLYASVSKGFSPPTTAEILPSTTIINTALQAEKGINYEAGAKGNLKNGFYFDVNAFFFRLQNAIVQRRDASGGDFFINAGSTKQNGVETFLSYRFLNSSLPMFSNTKLWLSHTWHNFHYSEFRQINNNFSGKKLPSIAPHIIAAGIDINSPSGLYSNLTYYYIDKIMLNDANTDMAAAYDLVGLRVGYKKHLKKNIIEIFAGAENIFNTKYSLGNDINAFGGRYYNAAPGRNYFAGIYFRFNNRYTE